MNSPFEINESKKFIAHIKDEIKKEALFCEEVSKRYTHRLHSLETCLREYEKALYHLDRAKENFINANRR